MKKLGSVLSVLVLVISIIAPFWGIRVHALGDFEENGIVYELQENDTYAVIECNSDAEKTIIPSKVNGKEVTKIKSFNNFTGKEVEFAETVKEIGNYAFECRQSLNKVVLHDGLDIIGEKAFSGCVSLETIEIPETVKEIGDFAFWFCSSLNVIEMPNTVRKLGESAFQYCFSLDKAVLSDNLEVIKRDTFSGCNSLRTIKLPENIKSIEELAFKGCSLLKSIEIPSEVINIDKSAFNYCHILQEIFISAENNNFKVLEDGSLFDNNKNEVIVHVDKNDLAEKEKMSDIVYDKLKGLMFTGNLTFEELNEKVTDFMQERGGGKPKVVSKEEFEKEVLMGNRKTLYRGIKGKKYFEQMKTGEKAYFSTICNSNGNGIYTTSDGTYAGVYTENKTDDFVMRMYLEDDAKVISVENIAIIGHIIRLKHYEEFPERKACVSENAPVLANNKDLLGDRGLLAYILGYDAIDSSAVSEEFGASRNEMVVVNRSKLVVCDEEILI